MITPTTTYLGMDCVEVKDVNRVMDIYKKMREDGLEKGYTPCIVFASEWSNLEDEVERVKQEYGSLEKLRDDSLKEYVNIDVSEFFKERFDPDMEQGQVSLGDEKPEKTMSVYCMSDEAYIVMVPTVKPYEVFAYIPVGGWNECPDNAQHIAVAKYWYEKYGAVPCAVTGDTIQYYVPNPVKDNNSELANEMGAYCSDIVYQGVNSLANLAEATKDSTVWFFWWD